MVRNITKMTSAFKIKTKCKIFTFPYILNGHYRTLLTDALARSLAFTLWAFCLTVAHSHHTATLAAL